MTAATEGLAGLGYPSAVPLALINITPESGIDLGPITLGFYGVGEGPYLVLPLLGPSTVRDTSPGCSIRDV